MPQIQVLAPHVADMIAAGEVVERPASVVKELAENAVDAGATAVTIEIRHGGMALIRVADNGCGIPADQCETAFLRHATSKLRTADDLMAIGTLGFRGEALAAISSVSRMEMFTRTADDKFGTVLTLEGGVVISSERTGCPLGTTMLVRDLFFNTPARLKFMKRDTAEASAVLALVHRMALSHPEVAFQYIRDGKKELVTPGDGELRSAMYAVFGRDIAVGFSPVKGEAENTLVTGFVSLPACCRGTRGYQHFFVNGRQVKSKILTAALERAYENRRMVGKFPGCVLQVQLRADLVDVNVHPAKTEVRFLYERQVFDAVYYTVMGALDGDTSHPGAILPPQPELPKPVQQAQPLRDGRAEALQPVCSPNSPEIPQQVKKPVDKSVETVENSPDSVVKSPKGAGTEVISPVPPLRPVPPAAAVQRQESAVNTPPAPPVRQPEPEPAQETIPVPQARTWRLAGEVLRTYLIVESGETMYLIDKHAAHERILFDKMRAADWQPMAQSLLTPLVCRPSPEESEILLRNLSLLERFGFSCEPFDGGTLLLREIPSDIAPGQAEETLCGIAAEMLSGGANPDSARDAVLHTMACKAAVKGGQDNSRRELEAIVDEVLSGRVQYCPHGRPVAMTLTRAQLEKQFKRRV